MEQYTTIKIDKNASYQFVHHILELYNLDNQKVKVFWDGKLYYSDRLL